MVAIAILDDYQNLARTLADWSALEARHSVTVFDRHMASEDEVTAALGGVDAVCLMRERTPFGAAQIARLPDLKLIVTAGMKNAAIDVAAAKARGIVVSGTAQASHATAELTLGLMLSLARRIHTEAARMRQGGWQSTVGEDLTGKTLGIIGLGHLGGKLAGYGRALGMEVIAWSENLTEEAAEAKGARLVDKAELFRRADWITIHTRLSPRTRGLVGAAEIALMRRSAYLINTSRGPIVDTDALATALEAGRIAGAALDVFEPEPLPAEHRLRSVPGLLLTPHLGYWTKENLAGWYGGMADAVAQWIAGTPVRVIEP